VSKRSRERDSASQLIDPEFERALEENEFRRKARDARQEQKTHQLCRQVQRALNLALAGQFTEGTLDNVYVAEVSATGGTGRLLVHVALPEDRPVSAVLAELRDRAPQLRAIVAGFITRKRAPYEGPATRFAISWAHSSILCWTTSGSEAKVKPVVVKGWCEQVQERMMRDVLEALAYSSSSGWQDEACQALEEWWIDGALFRPREG
jgi:hypothetical protein